MTVSETWEDFESALTSVLLDLEEREMITIKLAGGEVPFIQFAGLGSLKGVDEIRAEFSAENVEDDRGVSTTFTPEQRAFFTQAGFAVAKEGLVWRRDYPWPTPSRTILEVVAACITPASGTLRESTAPNSCVTWPGDTPPGGKHPTVRSTSPETWILRSPNSASPTNNSRFQKLGFMT